PPGIQGYENIRICAPGGESTRHCDCDDRVEPACLPVSAWLLGWLGDLELGSSYFVSGRPKLEAVPSFSLPWRLSIAGFIDNRPILALHGYRGPGSGGISGGSAGPLFNRRSCRRALGITGANGRYSHRFNSAGYAVFCRLGRFRLRGYPGGF